MFIGIHSSLLNCKSKRQKKKKGIPKYCWKWTGPKHLTPYLAFWTKLNCYAAVSLHQWQAISCPSAVQLCLLPQTLAATDCHKCLWRNLLAINISDGGMMHDGLVSGSPILQLISICNISQLAQDRDQHGGRDDPAYCERTTAHRDGWSRIDADSLTSIPAQWFKNNE